MVNLDEMFGTTPRADVELDDMTEGYQVGTLTVSLVHAAICEEHKGRSRAYREGILEALRDML